VRNALVDLSNYVMCDTAQPNHAYDADQLHGGLLQARSATAGEVFLGLDDIKRTLDPEDIVIADARGPVALGGVIGGQETAVRASTSRLVLESANFDPVRIRRSTKRHGLRTDASNRFEKSQPAFGVPLALHRYVTLLKRLQPNVAVRGSVVESFPEPQKPVRIATSVSFIRERLGAPLEDSRITGILRDLGFGLSESADGALEVDVPYFRATRDISIPEDLVEEVGRIHGYENIPEQAPLIVSVAPRPDPLRNAEHRIRDWLSGHGLNECSGYSFVNRERLDSLGFPLASTIELANPPSTEESLLRPTLIPSVLTFAERNVRYFERFGLFELGRAFSKEKPTDYPTWAADGSTPAFERRMLALLTVSPRDERGDAACLPTVAAGAGFYALRTTVLQLLRDVSGRLCSLRAISPESFGTSPVSDETLYAAPRNWMHPYRAASIHDGETTIGCLAEVRPGIIDAHARVVVAEIDLNLLLGRPRSVARFEGIPRFPESFFEISVVTDRSDTYAAVEQLVRASVPEEYLRHIDVVSNYEGPPLASNERSLSLRLHFGASDRTLSGDEVRGLQDAVMSAVDASRFHLRS
ncbi:MAG: phenylalanine--tRNA ligase subunit beta, partial [Bdellovibrionales bacterium]|nr:phenylalanine--tRNA ligase subunit beta [Bdellovibrionales bacterium]